LVLDQSNPETLVALGTVDRVRGNLDQALAHLAQAIELQPGLVEAYLELGLTYQDRREVSNAIKPITKPLPWSATIPAPTCRQQLLTRKAATIANAEFMLRQASQLSPSDQNIRRQLAAVVALNIVNNLQEAPKR
jgi:tetratricopeptide (TPR) repeat protein